MDLFGTAGVRGPVPETLTPDLALRVGRAVGREGGEVVVGRDGRTTGQGLADAVAAGVESAGARTVRVGQVPTPVLGYATRGRRGVMVTASHNPPTDNGLKLFADGREVDAAREAEIEERVAAERPAAPWDEWGDSERAAVLDEYRERVASFAADHGAPLDGLRVLVDCGNGVAARSAPAVLTDLGADVTTLHANVDGRFPGRESKPTPETLAGTAAFMADAATDGEAYDLGVAFDGDGDRIVVLDGDGAVVHEDTVLAALAGHYARRSDADEPVVVTTPNASARVDEQVADAGGRVERVALGTLHEGVAQVEAAGGTVAFAGEPWKHLHTDLGDWIDGTASAAVIARLVADAGGIAPLRAPITELPYRKANVDCPDERKDAAMARVQEALPAAFPDADVDTAHGVRVDRPDGAWVLVRASGTEPYLRVYAEGADVDAILDAALAVVEDAVDAAR